MSPGDVSRVLFITWMEGVGHFSEPGSVSPLQHLHEHPWLHLWSSAPRDAGDAGIWSSPASLHRTMVFLQVLLSVCSVG